jgi:hypothetical protein
MTKILANASAADRSPSDFYETPEDVTLALLDFLRITPCRIWEPACGNGAITRVLKEQGHEVAESDIKRGFDFLEHGRKVECDWIITNPPFNLAHEFIERALTMDCNVAMLLKSQFWHAKKRLVLYKHHRPRYVLPLSWRPDFLFGAKSGAPTMEVQWTVWQRVPANETFFFPLPRPNKKEQAHEQAHE